MCYYLAQEVPMQSVICRSGPCRKKRPLWNWISERRALFALLKESLKNLDLIEDKDLRKKVKDLLLRVKRGGKVRVVTHGGIFHADDVCACVLLGMIFGFSSLEIIRTREEKYFKKADFVVDISQKFDAGQNGWKFFDHHQNLTFKRDGGWPYAAFGLLFKYLGVLITGDIETAEELDNVLIRHVDATDCGYIPDSRAVAAWKNCGDDILRGVKSMSLKNKAKDDIQIFIARNSRNPPSYSLSKAISAFNANWDEDVDQNNQFCKAMDFAKNVLERELARIKSNRHGHDELAKKICEADKNQDEILVLNKYIPLGSEELCKSSVKFVVFPDTGGKVQFDAKAVPPESGSFDKKIPFPEQWCNITIKDESIIDDPEELRKIKEAKLQQVTGVEDAVFCHRSGFIAGAKTVNGAIKLARLALEAWKSAGNQ